MLRDDIGPPRHGQLRTRGRNREPCLFYIRELLKPGDREPRLFHIHEVLKLGDTESRLFYTRGSRVIVCGALRCAVVLITQQTSFKGN